MLEFKYAKLDDRKWIEPIFKNSGYIGADYCFGSLYLWQEAYKCKIYKDEKFLYRIYDGEEPSYAFPVGNGDYKNAINILIKDASERNIPYKMFGLTAQMRGIIEAIMPNKFKFELKRDMSDYIYNSEDLSNLQGKKYHSKRNHVSKFKKTYNWTYADITEKNLKECFCFLEEWFLINKDRNLESEELAIKKAFDNYFELKLIGGYLKVDENIVALTIGEKINDDVFDIHFEKALLNYSGSYPAINQEFAKRKLSSYKYINREEDIGIEGLRKSKLSYSPTFLLDRYVAYLE